MAAAVDICNWALTRLGEPRVNSIDPPFSDAGSIAPTLAFLYPLARDAELRAHPWSFARQRVILPADGDTPAFDFAYQFRKPSDFLRLVKTRRVDWQIEGEFIRTNCAPPLSLAYIRRVTDTTLFDALFVKALSCSLALELTETLTTSNTKKQLIKGDYNDAIAEARKANAFEREADEEPEDDFVTVRR